MGVFYSLYPFSILVIKLGYGASIITHILINKSLFY